MVGTIKLQPVTKLFAGMQVVDPYLQVMVVIDPELKWRGPGPLSYEQTKVFGCLCKFRNSETQMYRGLDKLRELVVQTEVGTVLPLKYDQWREVVHLHRFYLDIKPLSHHYEVQTVAIGTELENVSDMDVAWVLDLHQEYTLHDMKKLARDAFICASVRTISFDVYWAEYLARITKQK